MTIYDELWYREGSGDRDLQSLLKSLPMGPSEEDLSPLALFIARNGISGLTGSQVRQLTQKFLTAIRFGSGEPQIIEAASLLLENYPFRHTLRKPELDLFGVPLYLVPERVREVTLEQLEEFVSNTDSDVSVEQLYTLWNLAASLDKWPEVDAYWVLHGPQEDVPKVTYEMAKVERHLEESVYTVVETGVLHVGDMIRRIIQLDKDWEIQLQEGMLQTTLEIGGGVHTYLQVSFPGLSRDRINQVLVWVGEELELYG